MTRKLLITLGTAIAINASLWNAAYASNTGTVSDRAKDPIVAALAGKGARIGYHRATGRVNFVGFAAGKAVLAMGAAPGLQAQQNAMAVLQQYAPLFGIESPGTDLQLMKQSTRENGRAMVRYQQVYKGLPVIGAEMIVNLDEQGRMLSLNGETAPKLGLNISPTISSAQAVETALESVAKQYQLTTTSLSTSEPVLSVYDPGLLGPNTHPASLVWQIEVTANSVFEPVREYVLVDANRGNIVLEFNQIHQMKARYTYSANNSTILPGALVCFELHGDACSNGVDSDADAAHLYAGDTYDFFSNTHARDSLNNAGMALISTVHYDVGYQNAYWSGRQMVYGDGFSLADDVVAHELTHGFTDKTSRLFYYYQSGAINESLSDLWGEFIDQSNTSGTDGAAEKWQLGEDLPPAVGVIRDMSDPTLFNDPDRMSSPFYNATGSDNGGVHTNSGINNKAVFLMTDGGSFNGQTITAMGISKVAKIYYEAQTTLLTSASDYLDLYNALYQACQNLVGTVTTNADCTNVRNATLAVEMNLEPSVGYNPEASMCTAGYSVVNTFYDDFESGLGSWTLTHDPTLGNYNWLDWYGVYGSLYGPYATSGLRSLFGFNAGQTSDLYARISVSVPNASGHTPYLHFNHAYYFEGGSYDGGVVEYSTNSGSTWLDASSLIVDGRNYNGTIGNLFSNPLAGRDAFVNDSHGYVSTRMDLSTLAGQSVYFRWRVGNDSGVEWLGWFLDDVRVYHCNRAPVATAQGLATNEDTVLGITLTGSDVDSDSINYSISAAPANGSLSGTAPNLTYTPNANYFGADSFSYTVDDGAGLSDTAVISITVNSINDAPSGATLVSPADSAINVSGSSVVFKWQPSSDVDGDAVSYEHKLCEDAALTVNCNSVVVASLQTNILVAGIGGGSLLLLGIAGMSLRRKQLVWAIPLYVAIALLTACSSSSDDDPLPVDNSITTTVTGLNPNTTYYWKVVSSDGNGGSTDSSMWSFTTKP